MGSGKWDSIVRYKRQALNNEVVVAYIRLVGSMGLACFLSLFFPLFSSFSSQRFSSHHFSSSLFVTLSQLHPCLALHCIAWHFSSLLCFAQFSYSLVCSGLLILIDCVVYISFAVRPYNVSLSYTVRCQSGRRTSQLKA